MLLQATAGESTSQRYDIAPLKFQTTDYNNQAGNRWRAENVMAGLRRQDQMTSSFLKQLRHHCLLCAQGQTLSPKTFAGIGAD
jgi:hypothetical protein